MILDRELLLYVSRKLRRRLPPSTRVLYDHTEAIRRGAGGARVGREERFQLPNDRLSRGGGRRELELIAMLVPLEEPITCLAETLPDTLGS